MTKTAFLRTGMSLVNAAEHREVVCNILDQTQVGMQDGTSTSGWLNGTS
jgi:hypothetical protein